MENTVQGLIHFACGCIRVCSVVCMCVLSSGDESRASVSCGGCNSGRGTAPWSPLYSLHVHAAFIQCSFTRCGVRHTCMRADTRTHTHALTQTHMRFHNNAMLPSSHLLNGVGIAATSPGLSFDWWRILSVCVCVCVSMRLSMCDSEPPPGRGWIMAGSDSAKTPRRTGRGAAG